LQITRLLSLIESFKTEAEAVASFGATNGKPKAKPRAKKKKDPEIEE
jgi:hypothetical protein